MVSPHPRLTVIGNCQAESLRKLIHSTGEFISTRLTPVHELTAADIPALRALLAATDVLITQPIRDDYRGLPVGTRQLRALLPAGARHLVVPVLRYDGLMPYQAIIRDPLDTSRNPPLVPYHDLRILCEVARETSAAPVSSSAPPANSSAPPAPPVAPSPAAASHAPFAAPFAPPSPAALRQAAALSVEQLRRREQAHGSIPISDVLAAAPVWHTINHPDNATLAELARRVVRALGGDPAAVTPPEYEMLGETQAPLDPAAAHALGVAAPERNQWTFRGEIIPDSDIRAAHREFYREHPHIVHAGLSRHRDRISVLGLLR